MLNMHNLIEKISESADFVRKKVNENKIPILFLTAGILLDKITSYYGLNYSGNSHLEIYEGNIIISYLANNFGMTNGLIAHGCAQESLIPLGTAEVENIFEKNKQNGFSKLAIYGFGGLNYIAVINNLIYIL